MIEEIGKELIKQSGSVVGKAYDDLIHPAAKSIGNTISLLPRTIGACFNGLERWLVNGRESLDLTAQAVQEKVAKIPPEKLTEPDPYVAIPAIQQLSYCYDSEELREMYANLLVSSMNTDTKNSVHPAFVDIIKQLTPDEAKLLKCLSIKTGNPLIDIYLNDRNGNYQIVVKNFTSLGRGICDNPLEIFTYLDNLERLKIINIMKDIVMSESDLYKQLEEDPFIVEIMNEKLPEGQSYTIKRNIFHPTSFGEKFIKVCIGS